MKTFSKVCICGGGSVAHVLAAVLGNNRGISVRVLTRKPELWAKQIKINYKDSALLIGNIEIISDDPARVMADVDLILLATPSFAYAEVWNRIKAFVPPTSVIGAFSGNGGFEWITCKHKGTIFGMQRIPYVCRILKYGESVYVSGVREDIYIGTRPAAQASLLAPALSALLQINVQPLGNYLMVCLSPANPIMHSVRLYSIYLFLLQTNRQDVPLMFYRDWDCFASELFLACSEEICNICKSIGEVSLDKMMIGKHYSIETALELTNVIRDINSLTKIEAPCYFDGERMVIDFNHRFFTEDVLINLRVFGYLSTIAGVETPVIDKILDWGISMQKKHNIGCSFIPDEYAKAIGLFDKDIVRQFYS